MLLAVSDGAFTAEELEVGAVGTEIPDLGPAMVLAVLLDADTESRTTSVLAFDAPLAIFPHTKVMGTEPRWPGSTVHFVVEGRWSLGSTGWRKCVCVGASMGGGGLRSRVRPLHDCSRRGREAPTGARRMQR